MERENLEAVNRAAEEGRRKYAEAGEKARQKREERARARAKAEAQAAGEGGDTSGFDLGQVRTIPSPTKAKAKAEARQTKINIQSPTAGPAPAINHAGHFHTVQPHPTFPDLSLGKPITNLPHPLFPFPATPRHAALLQTFTDLQRRQYRMGLGPRFGGEYLVYPGDYLRYHAHFTSQVIVDQEPIKPTELVAWGRLGTGTKKAGLLCCVTSPGSPGATGGVVDQEEKGRVDYYSLEWANFG